MIFAEDIAEKQKEYNITEKEKNVWLIEEATNKLGECEQFLNYLNTQIKDDFYWTSGFNSAHVHILDLHEDLDNLLSIV